MRKRHIVSLMALFTAFLLNSSQLLFGEDNSPFQNVTKYDAASVVISGGRRSCSGTLICPWTVLTAAHCWTTGRRVTVSLSNGSRINGKVIAHQERNGVDAAIIRLDSAVRELPHVSVASNYPPDKSEVLVYGRARAAGSTEITRFRSRVDLRGDGGWLDLVGDTAGIGGESGGGVFYDGKLIGVVARTESGRAYRTGKGKWTGVSVTDKTHDLVVKHLCSDKDCKT